VRRKKKVKITLMKVKPVIKKISVKTSVEVKELEELMRTRSDSSVLLKRCLKSLLMRRTRMASLR